jgi:hypothetical protein
MIYKLFGYIISSENESQDGWDAMGDLEDLSFNHSGLHIKGNCPSKLVRITEVDIRPFTLDIPELYLLMNVRVF